jgi:ERCC4-related helicase
MIWFLAPGVELCRQQHDTLAAFLPHVRTRLLIGSDNIDRWGEKSIWDAALHQVRIVVSTHAVLAQALEHAFVSISQLALLVFDEGKSI